MERTTVYYCEPVGRDNTGLIEGKDERQEFSMVRLLYDRGYLYNCSPSSMAYDTKPGERQFSRTFQRCYRLLCVRQKEFSAQFMPVQRLNVWHTVTVSIG
jgi:hypothetical protein